MVKTEAKEEIKKILPTYIKFLKNIYSQREKINLKSICMIFPIFELNEGKSVGLFEEIVDEIEKIGYTTNCSLIYKRDYQVIKRQIVVFDVK